MRTRTGHSKSSQYDDGGRRAKRSRKKLSSKNSRLSIEDAATAITEDSQRETAKKPPRRKNNDLERLRKMGHRRTRYIRDEATKETEEAISNWVDKTTTQGANDISLTGVSEGNIKKWVHACCRKGLKPLLKEFSTIRKYLPKDVTIDIFNKNMSKNRYTDVLCLDSTRVLLKGRSNDSDYIHANWVLLPTHRKYICTQAPLDETIEDFWLMVVKERVPAIVMLCDLYENGEPKSSEYYPCEVGKNLTFGETKVSNLQREKNIETIVCFTLCIEARSESHKVMHYKWVDWPDRVAPPSASPIVSLVQHTKPLCASGPIVVHCSAGIGRTGTYCALEYAIDKILLGNTLSILEVIKEVRKQRLHSVQTTLQYLYLHVCIFEYLIVAKAIQKDTNIRKFQREYENYLRKFNDKRKDANC